MSEEVSNDVLDTLKGQWEGIMMLSDTDPAAFADSIGKQSADILYEIAGEIAEGGVPENVVRQARIRQEYKRSGKLAQKLNADDMEYVHNMAISSLQKGDRAQGLDLGDSIKADLMQEIQRIWPTSDGNQSAVANQAASTVFQRMTRIGDSWVRDGNMIERRIEELSGGQLSGGIDKYLEGINDNPEYRKIFTGPVGRGLAGKGLPYDFDLRDSRNSYTVDGRNLLISTPRAGGGFTWLTIPLPTSKEHFLETEKERMIKNLRTPASTSIYQDVGWEGLKKEAKKEYFGN